MKAGISLRQSQSQQVRAALLEAMLGQLEGGSGNDVPMAAVARAAGVSLRTLYRYFPRRAALLQAAGEHLYASLGVPFHVEGPEDVSASFRQAAARLASRPRLTRALVRTATGRLVRSAVRRQRVAQVRAALRPATHGVDADTARGATAVIAHLCSAASWVSIAEESGLRDADAQAAVGWAIDALVESLRRAQRPVRRRGVRRRRARWINDVEEATA